MKPLAAAVTLAPPLEFPRFAATNIEVKEEEGREKKRRARRAQPPSRGGETTPELSHPLPPGAYSKPVLVPFCRQRLIRINIKNKVYN